MPTHREEAIRALRQVHARLSTADPIDGLTRVTLRGQVEYAIAEVEAVQEVKRVRKVKADEPEATSA